MDPDYQVAMKMQQKEYEDNQKTAQPNVLPYSYPMPPPVFYPELETLIGNQNEDFNNQMRNYRENQQGRKNDPYQFYSQQHNNSISTMNYPQNNENLNEYQNYEYANEQENGSKANNTICCIATSFAIIIWIVIIFLFVKSIHFSKTVLH